MTYCGHVCCGDSEAPLSLHGGRHNIGDYTNSSVGVMIYMCGRSKGNQDLWIGGSVHTVCSAQSDTAAGARHTEFTSSAASASGILGDTRTQGKPVMGLRQHNQTRKPRILSQAQLSQASSNGGGNAVGGGNWLRMNSIQNNTFSQPNSEFSLNYEGGEQTEKLSKASSTCEDRIRQSHSGVLSDSTSSVPQSCHSGGDNTNGDEPEPQWLHHCINRCLGANNSNGIGLSSNSAIAQILLSGLAGAAPYPRLADIARYALLACEQRDTLCARQEAELTVLEASLAEAKAAGDQLHCRLGQVETSWGAASRAADLADMALETSGILLHLYSSELALLLHKQPNHNKSSSSKSHHHHQRSFGRLGTFSSSTSTSSSSCTTSSEDEEVEDECVHPRPPCKPPVPAHMIPPNNRTGTVNNGDAGRHPQLPPGTTASDNGSNVYAVYAPNGKSSEETGSHISIPTWIPPHNVCNGPACLRLLKMQRHQTEVAALQLLARFVSTPEPFFKPESLISAAPGEDFEPNGINGNRSIATCTESGLGVESGGSSSGMGAHGVYANAWCIASRPVAPMRQPFKSGGGWQTPDSGAGSFSTNDHAGNATTVSAVSGVSTTHSSNSSASSVPPNMVTVGVNPTASVASDSAGWSRMKEMKLRHILDQIIWERMLVRSTIAASGNDFESANSGVPPNAEFNYMKPYTGSEMPTYSDGANMSKDSREPGVFSRLNALMLLDTAVLLQDLCAVKEDRAKLKVQNYIMEKELRAIQVSHQGHCLSESALRNQLNALQIDRNLHMLKNSDRNGSQGPLAQQIESLQSAFESLRKGTEQHQSQSEELVNDLKQANAALITAFEKAKSKYLARIRKLESHSLSRGNSSSAMPPTNTASNFEKQACSAGRPPAVPAHRNSQPPPPLPPLSPAPPSDVYEVIQDTHIGPPNSWQNAPVVSGSGRSEPPMPNGCYSLVRTGPFYPKSHSMLTDNRSPTRPR
ncbi:unnamed protein product [Rodentolepis nana]|uniref:MCC-bdg_PDZ domain-containing protein n=1 Tax=Rodentolepis nana TaxID=102285 RepID=A0A158QH16_RODNA|nr:unnamed protein product [Rodentolepis nana]